MGNKPNTILIIDDDKTVIEQLQTHFRRRSYEPIATADPTVVTQTLNTFEVHLILLDLRMERLNGYEVLQGLKEQDRKIPVLIITAYYEDEKERLAEAGITQEDVIEKPFRNFSKIESSINRKLNRVVTPGEVGSDYEDEIYFANKTKIVVVDDETEMTDILEDVLTARNYEVKVFADGSKARDYILENDCHLVIVDMKIPHLSGDKLIQAILAKKPALKIIPISAAYEQEMRDLLSEIGFDREKLVVKPFDLATLVEQLKVLATQAGTLGPG